MWNLFEEAGKQVFFNLFQLMAGCILAVVLYRIFYTRRVDIEHSYLYEFTLIAFGSVCGVILPLNIYGLIPVLATLAAVGVKDRLTVPVLISNSLFSIMLPFTEVGFVWSTAAGRIILSVIMGIGAGLLLRLAKQDGATIFRTGKLRSIVPESAGIQEAVRIFGISVSEAGLFLAVGAIVYSVLRKYFFTNVLSGVFTSTAGSLVSDFLLSHNATMNPYFRPALVTAGVIMNPVTVSGLFVLLKARGALLFVAYYSLAVLLLVAMVLLT